MLHYRDWEHRVSGKILARKLYFAGPPPNRPSCEPLARLGNDLISHHLAYNDGYCLLGLAVGEAAAAGAGVVLTVSIRYFQASPTRVVQSPRLL